MAYIAFKKKLEKWPFLDQNHGLNPNIPEYRKKHFPALYYIKRKMEKWPFFDQNHGLIPLEKFQFYHFLNFLFL